MYKEYKTKNVFWIDIVDPSKEEIDKLITEHGFHELDREALLEENQRVRVDNYKDYIFIVINFPKYDTKTRRYINNEFNIFISKYFIITVRYYNTSHIDLVFDRYKTNKVNKNEINSGYILYNIIDAMLDKAFKILDRQKKDLRQLESLLFSKKEKNLINEIMIKKRNIITLKHMFAPQIQVLKMLENSMNDLFKNEIELYFENIIDKLEKISSEIFIIQENIESMEDTLKSIFDMQTSIAVKYLTIFSAFMLPLTLVTGFFGMNLKTAPFEDFLVYSSFIIAIIVMGLSLIFLMRKSKI